MYIDYNLDVAYLLYVHCHDRFNHSDSLCIVMTDLVNASGDYKIQHLALEIECLGVTKPKNS